MCNGQDIFQRVELLVGEDALRIFGNQRVIVFGVGGVGSWCVESLVRSGIGHLTIVDSDCVCPSNINRQLMATTTTIGHPKVEVLKERMLDINPALEITSIQDVYSQETYLKYDFNQYDYIIDAIDSLKDKELLILQACKSKAKLYSSMGAALKMNPQMIQVAEFWKVKGCPLARALRTRFKKGERPARKFKCVFSEERLKNHDKTSRTDANGTLMHATAIFGLTLAGLVIQDILEKHELHQSD